MSGIGYIFAIIALVSFSLGDTISKKVSVRYGNYLTALFVLGFGILPLFGSLFFLPQNVLNLNSLAFGLIGGFFFALGYVLVYKSLESEQASNTWAFLNLSIAAIVLFGVFALKEPVSPIQIISIILIFGGVLMVTITKELGFNRLLLPAILGNLSWALFLVFLTYLVSSSTSESTGFFLIARVFGFLMLLAYLLITKKLNPKTMKKLRKPDLVAVASGVFDGLGQTFTTMFILAQFVVIGGSITALEPAVVVILGTFLFREKLTRVQLTGIIISVVAAAVLGLVQ